jgi:hypothetical protein
MSDVINKIPRISQDITTRFLGDEAVIMNLKTVKTFSLNETAAKVWSYIDGSITIDEIVQKVFAEYDVTDTACRDAVTEIIGQFSSENIIELVDPHE